LPLTKDGEDEARAIAPYLRDVPFTAVWTSPLLRARRTCELAGLGGQARIDADLCEWDYGDYEGQRSADIRMIRPDWSVFRDGCPHGESPQDVSDRADRVIGKLLATGGTTALFSHGQFTCSLAARWMELPVLAGGRFSLGTASVSVLGHSPSQPLLRVMERWNLAPNLAGAARPGTASHN
jgi:probable phosphoglycerate mutase